MRFIRFAIIFVFILATLSACNQIESPIDLPTVPSAPSLPSISELPDMLKDLELPNLSGLSDVPELSDLPALQVPDGGIVFAGPTERQIGVGERIPGTDIELTGISEDGAEFRIAGLRSVRALGDSLDFDGNWPGIDGVAYSLRLRIYRIGDNSVRAAGVHRVVVENIQPVAQPVSLTGVTLKAPYVTSAAAGEILHGLTYRYVGRDDRGAELAGLATDEYPYRKTGDSIRWEGRLRPDIPVKYELRVLFYGENTLQVGGIVTLGLPER